MICRIIKIDNGQVQINEDGHFWIRDKRDNFCFEGQFERESALQMIEILRMAVYKFEGK